jgi:hypothetical protein
LRTSHPKAPMPETARESPVGEIDIQKRQSIFGSGLARGRPAESEPSRIAGVGGWESVRRHRIVQRWRSSRLQRDEAERTIRTKLLQANRLRTSHPKPPMPETARESPAGKIAIQKRQSIFDSGLARGRPAESEPSRIAGVGGWESVRRHRIVQRWGSSRLQRDEEERTIRNKTHTDQQVANRASKAADARNGPRVARRQDRHPKETVYF